MAEYGREQRNQLNRAVANSETGSGRLKGFADNRPQAINQTELTGSIQKKENRTGLPDDLKAGVENLSGFNMDNIRVHYNSDMPAQLQAFAYTRGADIYVGPGQEKYLSHEAWHVVQQKQGRVNPGFRLWGANVNYEEPLEREADSMGLMCLRNDNAEPQSGVLTSDCCDCDVIQGGWKDWLKIVGKLTTGIGLPILLSFIPGGVPIAGLLSGGIDVVNSGLGTISEIKKKKKFIKDAHLNISGCSGSIEAKDKLNIDATGVVETEGCDVNINVPQAHSITCLGGSVRDETAAEKVDRATDPLATASGGILGALGSGHDLYKAFKNSKMKDSPDWVSVASALEYFTGNIGRDVDLLPDCCDGRQWGEMTVDSQSDLEPPLNDPELNPSNIVNSSYEEIDIKRVLDTIKKGIR